MTDFKKEVAPLLKELIRLSNISQEDFAMRNKMRPSALGKAIRGQHVPKADLFMRILKHLNLDVMELIERKVQAEKARKISAIGQTHQSETTTHSPDTGI